MNFVRVNIKGTVLLLAFMLMVKNAQPNSILYEEPLYKMAHKVGISDGRIFKKYLNQALESGLCTQHIHRFNTNGKRVGYHFVSYFEALTQLLGFNGKELQKFTLHRNLGKLHNYKKQIELDLISLNFSQ